MSQVGTKWQKVKKKGQNRIWKQKLNLETIKIFNEKSVSAIFYPYVP